MTKPWPMVPLGEVLIHRKEFIQIDDAARYKRCRVKLHAQGIVLRDEVPGIEIKTKKQQVCKAGEFLVAEIDAKVGGFGIVPDFLESSIVSSHYFLFQINESRLNRKFLDYFIRTPDFRDQVSAQGSTNYAAIRPKEVLGYKIPLPPLSEQKRIVARIGELAAKIEEAKGLRQKAIEEAEALIDAAYTDIFRKDELKPFLIPMGVADLKINKESRNPQHYYSSGLFGYVDISSVGRGPFTLHAIHVIPTIEAPSRARRVIHTGDIIFSTVRPNLKAIAKIGHELEDQICSTGFAVLTPGLSLDSDFLLHQLCSSFIIDQCMSKTTGGHYPAINDTNFREVLISSPPLAEQRRIVDYLDDLQAKVDALKRLQAGTAAELNAMQPSVLDRAFKGEL